MIPFVFWYLIVTLVGISVFPLAYFLLPALPSRGYIISRILGILLWGYIFWLSSSLNITQNNIGGIVFALAILLLISAWALRRVSAKELYNWARSRSALILTGEILFFTAFAGWSLVRAANPEILGTEKPMELAFINAILRSPSFPPNDPWLSGYAISYYYFGYVLVAMIAKVTGVTGGVAFNLGISLVFALSVLGTYSLLYDLLAYWESNREGASRKSNSVLEALMAPLWVLLAGNLEGILHVLHSRGLFWKVDTQGNLTSAFWKWLDLRELAQPPSSPFSWIPGQHWWWWRASRVIQDYDLSGNWKEIIDEFPFFSYLLGDLHPHVLAMPFVLLVMTLALHLFLQNDGKCRILGKEIRIERVYLLFCTLTFGGLAFLNTWDFPIYVGFFCGAYFLKWVYKEGWNGDIFYETLTLGITLGLGGVLFYLPFYLGFSSQAGGILPNLINPTRGAHLWVMFGSLLIPIFLFLLYLWKSFGKASHLVIGFVLSTGVIVALWLLSLILGYLLVNLPIVGGLYLGSIGSVGGWGDTLDQSITRRLIYPGGWITLWMLLGMIAGLLWGRRFSDKEISNEPLNFSSKTNNTSWQTQPPSLYVFVLLLILFGTILVLVPEFFYLRDQFGWRMNTIFKFYYQAWLQWGVASAFGVIVLLRESRQVWKVMFSFVLMGVLACSLVYSVLSLWSKTMGFAPPQGLMLDGTAYLRLQLPDEMEAVKWLWSASPGIILEAVGPNGGSYTEYARISTLSGLPTVLGWVGHESQWRGGSEEMGNRMNDIEFIYRSSDWAQVEKLLQQYHVKYVYIGRLERNRYNIDEDKFERYLILAFQRGEVRIYQMP